MRPDLSAVQPLEFNLATRASVGDALTRSARMFFARDAIVDRGHAVTYRQLDDAAESLAHSLLDAGIGRQQPVAMLMDNSWQFVATYFACAKAGLVALPVNVALAPDDIGWILRDSGTAAIVADAGYARLLGQILPNLDTVQHVVLLNAAGRDACGAIAGRETTAWERLAEAMVGEQVAVFVDDRDIVQCLYTSGTTSQPKGVLTSHLSVLIGGMTNALIQQANWGSQPNTLVNVLPLFHTTALNTLVLPTLFTGGTAVLPGRFDADVMLDTIQAYRATHVMLLPNMYRAVLAAHAVAPRDLTSVRFCVYAMAPMANSVLDQIDEAFPNASVILGSGQTEVVPATVMQWPEHRHSKPNSWGPATPTVDVAIMGADGDLLAPGEEGEIVYRGPHVCAGYWNNAEANQAVFEHGWFHSGDIGYLDDDGVVWFTDRLKDIIKSGGENVSSVDVERVVAGAPGVAECSVVGLPDERWGEAVCAVVVPAEPAADPVELERQVIAHAKQHLAGFKVPKRVLVVDAVPKTATGKIRKHELRARFAR